MRRWAILAVVAAQVLVLVWMAGEREWIYRTGQVVYLRTAPVDPRDLFRGDFVRLQYEINDVRRDDLGPGVAEPPGERRRHEIVYTRLRPAGEGLYEAAGASATRPAEGLYLRGRTEESWRMGSRGPAHFMVKYGIEQFFVEQGSGHGIEKRRGTRDALQVPMEVEVAVASSGKAVIRGYRWSRLGMKLEVLRRPAPRPRNAAAAAGPLSPKLRVTLANTSDAPLTVFDTAEHCTFHLVPASRTTEPYPAAPSACTAEPPVPQPIALAPGETHSVEIDLSEPRWYVVPDDKALEIGALRRPLQFRIEYRAPDAALATDVSPAAWRGRLASQAFNASGVID